jgi:hypothetical protein
MIEKTHDRSHNIHDQGEMRSERNLSPSERNSEALQLEETVFGGNNEIAVWLCVINTKGSNVLQ